MIIDDYGWWTLWIFVFIMVLLWCLVPKLLLEIIILLMSTSWGFHPWGNLISSPTHQPGSKIPIQKKRFYVLLQTPPKNWGFNHPPAECCHGMSCCHPPAFMGLVMPEAPKPKAKMRPEDNGETKLQRSAGSEALSRFSQEGWREARFFLDMSHQGSRRDPKNKKKHRYCWSSLLGWFVGWFFWGATGRDFTKGGHIHKVEKCFGPLDDWRVCFVFFEIKIGFVPTKLEAFEPTTSTKSISTR